MSNQVGYLPIAPFSGSRGKTNHTRHGARRRCLKHEAKAETEEAEVEEGQDDDDVLIWWEELLRREAYDFFHSRDWNPRLPRRLREWIFPPFSLSEVAAGCLGPVAWPDTVGYIVQDQFVESARLGIPIPQLIGCSICGCSQYGRMEDQEEMWSRTLEARRRKDAALEKERDRILREKIMRRKREEREYMETIARNQELGEKLRRESNFKFKLARSRLTNEELHSHFIEPAKGVRSG